MAMLEPPLDPPEYPPGVWCVEVRELGSGLLWDSLYFSEDEYDRETAACEAERVTDEDRARRGIVDGVHLDYVVRFMDHLEVAGEDWSDW